MVSLFPLVRVNPSAALPCHKGGAVIGVPTGSAAGEIVIAAAMVMIAGRMALDTVRGGLIFMMFVFRSQLLSCDT
jgi:hypothetical protein